MPLSTDSDLTGLGRGLFLFTFGKVLSPFCVLCLLCAFAVSTLRAQSVGFVYVTNAGGNSGAAAGSISAYSIDRQPGGLLPVPGSPFADPGGPWSIAVDPKNRFAYIANRGDNTISAYAIGGTGALTPVPGSPFPQDPTASGELPVSVAVDPAGKFVFVANYNYRTVRAYQIDQNTGALTQAPGSPFPAGTNPQSVTVDLSGKFVYVASGYHNANGTVSAYTIEQSNGSLTAVPGSPFLAGAVPVGTAVDPAGRFVFTANQGSSMNNFTGTVSAYAVDANTGALAPVPGSPLAAGLEPTSIATAHDPGAGAGARQRRKALMLP